MSDNRKPAATKATLSDKQQALDLYPCKVCGRKFIKESLEKHARICKTVSKPRKVFDSSKQRATEDLSLKIIKTAQKKNIAPPKTNWRAKHEDLVNAVRAARECTIAQKEGRPLPPPPPPSINPDYVQCPYCDRRFNEKAAERHIVFCKEQSMRKGFQPKPNAAATSKQQIRTQSNTKDGYQAPKPKVKGNPGVGYPDNGPAGISGMGRGMNASKSSTSSKVTTKTSTSKTTKSKPTGRR